jgi:hypothetical protein
MTPPLEAGLGAVLCDRAEVDLALVVGACDQHRIDLDAGRPLELRQRRVRVLRFLDRRKASDDQAVCTVADDADYGLSFLLVGGRGRAGNVRFVTHAGAPPGL